MSAFSPGSQAATVAAQVQAYLVGKGLSPVAAAGIIGNMVAESSLNPEAWNPNDVGHPGGGLVGWNTGSYPDAFKLVTGNPGTDLTNQLDYLWGDISSSGLASKLNQATTPSEAAWLFANGFERCAECLSPGTSQVLFRQSNAEAWYSQAGADTQATGSPGGTAGTGQVVGGAVSGGSSGIGGSILGAVVPELGIASDIFGFVTGSWEHSVLEIGLEVAFTLAALWLILMGIRTLFPGVTRTITESFPLIAAAAA